MLFNHLKYLKPIWYYNLKPSKDYCYFPTEEQLKKASIYIEKDSGYVDEIARIHDLSWTAFQSGYIAKEPQHGIDIWQKHNFPIADEYRFLRKNFHSAWVYYVLLLRLFTLNNPFKEILGFLKSSKVQRVDYSEHILNDTTYETFESSLIASKPFISVIIPTLNRYEYLKDVLHDLEDQSYTNFEVIIVDQTDNFRPEFYEGWHLDLKFWHQSEKALWRARNEAIRTAKGDYILMSEDDIRFNTVFIENHIKAIDYFKCQVSCGVFFPMKSKIPKENSYFKFSEQFATGNSMFDKNIIKVVGSFDLQFEKQRGGDGEYGLRCYLAGFKLISNPKAFCFDVKAPSGGLRQMGSWDSWRPKKILGPRPVPSVLYLARKYFGTSFATYYIIHNILPSLIPYRFRKSKFLKALSFVVLPLVLPLVCFQVLKSWQLASVKIKEGSIIEKND